MLGLKTNAINGVVALCAVKFVNFVIRVLYKRFTRESGSTDSDSIVMTYWLQRVHLQRVHLIFSWNKEKMTNNFNEILLTTCRNTVMIAFLVLG